MSFTEDELQAFNSILEQRFVAHRQEMELAIAHHLNSFQRDIESRFQEMTAALEQGAANERARSDATIKEKFAEQHGQLAHTLSQEVEQKSRQVEVNVERLLSGQMQGIEQLLNQQFSKHPSEAGVANLHPQLETIEVQTDLSWEDLVDVMGKALDERLVSLNTALQSSVKNLEQHLAMRLHSLRDELVHSQGIHQPYSSVLSDNTSVQDVLAGIEHLERVMESMQVAMTANNALLSNRLYHHQQLPLERAHPNLSGQTHIAPANGVGSLLTQAKERLASGLEPGMSARRNDEEVTGQ